MHRRDRRPKWKRAVYAGCDGMTSRCQVVLLRLLDDMDANGNVSTPRSKLAADLGIAPARVTEAVKLARALGFLDIVRRARPKVTAVYQATLPRVQGTQIQDPYRGTDSVPHIEGSEVRMYPTQEGAGSQPSEPTPHGDHRNVQDHPSSSDKFGSVALAERPPNSGGDATAHTASLVAGDGSDDYDVIGPYDVIGDEETENLG